MLYRRLVPDDHPFGGVAAVEDADIVKAKKAPAKDVVAGRIFPD